LTLSHHNTARAKRIFLLAWGLDVSLITPCLLLAWVLLVTADGLLLSVPITWLWRWRLLLQWRQADIDSSFVLFQPPLVAPLVTELFHGRLDLWNAVFAVVSLPDDDVCICHPLPTFFLQLSVQDRDYLLNTLSVQIDFVLLY
jgi:hypothetical protein